MKNFLPDVFGLNNSSNTMETLKDHLDPLLDPLLAIMEHVPAFVSYVDTQVRYRCVSRHYEDYFDRKHDQIIGHEMREVIGEHAWQQVAPAMTRALKGEPAQFESRFAVVTKGMLWAQGTFLPHKDQNGDVLGVVIFVQDITSQKRYEEELKDKDAFYRSIFESRGLMNIETDCTEGRILRVNQLTCEVLGYDESELLDGRSLFDITHPDDRARNYEMLLPLIRGEVENFRIEKRYIRKDGSSVWVNVAVTTLKDASGKPARLLGQAKDITARVEADEERQKFVSLATESPQFKCMSDTNGKIFFMNDAAISMCGFRNRDEAIQSLLWDIFPEEDREATWSNLFQRASLSGREEIETRLKNRQTGEERWFVMTVFPVRDIRGNPIGLATVGRDITERKNAEQVLVEADHRKDEFLATLAHELRNPLAPISNALQIWAKLEHEPERLNQLRPMLERQVNQLKHLIDDLLDISRISKGKIELRTQSLDLVAVIKGAIESVQPSIDTAHHALHLNLPESPVWVEGDMGRLTQIFGNLIHNAAKYTKNNGEITVSLQPQGAWSEFRVRDNGLGIPTDMLSRIFEPFTQVRRTLDRAQGGLGIGLTLVRTLVSLHNGTIEAFSAGPNMGSEFVVRLPITSSTRPGTTEELAIPTSTHEPHECPKPHHRVLVVDDLRESADTLAMMLHELDVETKVAYDARSALEIAGSFEPDFVFSDIAMPGCDGFCLARQLTKVLGDTATLVALTGFGQQRDRERTREAGFKVHLVKPTTLEALREVLLHDSPSGAHR